MEDFGKYLISKFQQPIIANTILAGIYWNKHTIWVCLFISKEDFYTQFPILNNKIIYSKFDIITLVYDKYDKIQWCSTHANLFLIPLFSALFINLLTPYLKRTFKAIDENADKFLNFLRLKINRIEIVPKTELETLKADFEKIIQKLTLTEENYANLVIVNQNLKGQLTESQNSINKTDENLKRLETTLSGIWLLKYEFLEPDNNHHNGTEYFQIENGNYNINNEKEGLYNLRAKLIVLSYETSKSDFLERFVFIKDLYKFVEGKIVKSIGEISICMYETKSGNIFEGKEFYTQDGGRTLKEVKVHGSQSPFNISLMAASKF